MMRNIPINYTHFMLTYLHQHYCEVAARRTYIGCCVCNYYHVVFAVLLYLLLLKRYKNVILRKLYSNLLYSFDNSIFLICIIHLCTHQNAYTLYTCILNTRRLKTLLVIDP